MAALSCVALMNVVGRGEPFQFTTRPFTKFVPVTNKVKPAALQYGVEIDSFVGDTDRSVMVGPRIWKVSGGLDVPPPGMGLKTVTGTDAAAAVSAAGIDVLSCVGLR